MKVLVTGASGYLGNKLAHVLAGKGIDVHALVRSHKADALLQHPRIRIFKGDILQKETVVAAMKQCSQVYHAAAKTGVWTKDPSAFYGVNIEGTRNVLDAALALGVQKTVVTSSCGVIGPSLNGPLKEDSPRCTGFTIEYDYTKKKAEDLVLEYAKEGMDVVIVNPSKVYGPGNISHAVTANAVIDSFLKKKIAFIPYPGTYSVCFAFIDDVVYGHILAMEKGQAGEKYILGGVNISYREFFDQIRTLSNNKGHIVPLPKSFIKTWANMQMLNYKLFGKPVKFTPTAVDHFFSNYIFSSEKASKELGYKLTGLHEALEKTIHFLNQKSDA